MARFIIDNLTWLQAQYLHEYFATAFDDLEDFNKYLAIRTADKVDKIPEVIIDVEREFIFDEKTETVVVFNKKEE